MGRHITQALPTAVILSAFNNNGLSNLHVVDKTTVGLLAVELVGLLDYRWK